MLWLPWYFHYSIEAKQVESTGIGSDRALPVYRNVHMHIKVSSMFERMKRKENKEWKEKYDETQRSGKYRK